MGAPTVTSAERRAATATLDTLYRVDRHWRILGAVTSALAVAAIWTDYRATGAVLMAISIAAQIIAWAAMRAAQRVEAQRLRQVSE
jgi:hypothetical protein